METSVIPSTHSTTLPLLTEVIETQLLVTASVTTSSIPLQYSEKSYLSARMAMGLFQKRWADVRLEILKILRFTFRSKASTDRHKSKHSGIRYPCPLAKQYQCTQTFAYKGCSQPQKNHPVPYPVSLPIEGPVSMRSMEAQGRRLSTSLAEQFRILRLPLISYLLKYIG
jgi:hypothetical protein